MMTSPLLVGLTGGIASGKSTVSDEFKKFAIDIVDSDIGAREVVKKGTLGLETIIEHFGTDILLKNTNSENILDRHKLRRIVFENEKEPQRSHDSLGASTASRSLICVGKERMLYSVMNAFGGGDGGIFFGRVQPPSNHTQELNIAFGFPLTLMYLYIICIYVMFCGNFINMLDK